METVTYLSYLNVIFFFKRQVAGNTSKNKLHDYMFYFY